MFPAAHSLPVKDAPNVCSFSSFLSSMALKNKKRPLSIDFTTKRTRDDCEFAFEFKSLFLMLQIGFALLGLTGEALPSTLRDLRSLENTRNAKSSPSNQNGIFLYLWSRDFLE